MVEPNQMTMFGTFEGLHLSKDGTRIFFKNSSINGYHMNVGVFGSDLWSSVVPKVTDVSYPSDLFTKLENNERFDIKIAVSDPQGDESILDVERNTLFPNGYEDRSGAGPIAISIYIDPPLDMYNLYIAEGMRGLAWPSRTPIMTARFAAEDENGNVSYVDTLIQPPFSMAPIYYLLLN